MKKEVENTVLSVSEIAKTTGINRNTIWSFIKRNKIEPKNKKGRVSYFDKSIVSKIDAKYNKTKIKQSNYNVPEDVSKQLLKQIDKLNRRIDKKEEQIEKLTDAVEYFRQENVSLKLEGAKQKKELEDTKSKLLALPEKEEKRAKKHWWSIFSKK